MKKFLPLLAFCSGILALTLYSQPFVRVDQVSRAVSAPSVVTVTGTAQYVFTTNPSVTDGRVLSRTIQNTGTAPVLYAIGTVVSSTNYHGVLAGGLADRDGLGSLLDLSRFPGRVSVMVEGEEVTGTVALVELTQ